MANIGMTTSQMNKPSVGLFVTCLVDTFRPSVGFASIKLLEDAGCQVTIPEQQTCCGQPGYNPGDYESAAKVAKHTIPLFLDFDYLVAPSGSCAGMIKHHYPKLLKDEPEWYDKAKKLSEKTFELTSFLHDVLQVKPKSTDTVSSETYTFHDSCAGLRELNIKDQPRSLLKSFNNIEIEELQNTDECCGFGGTFCAKMPHISDAMVTDKLLAAEATGATTLLGGDMGCLLNIAGKASRQKSNLKVRHVAEVLADQLNAPAMGCANPATKEPSQ
ncbi:(Fe-S)-binding protein [Aurantivibrio plasticivorans]